MSFISNKNWLTTSERENHWRQDILEADYDIVINCESAMEIYKQNFTTPDLINLDFWAWWKNFITLEGDG